MESSEGGENTGGHIIVKHKGQAQNVNIQVQLGVRQNVLRGVDEPQQTPCRSRVPTGHQQERTATPLAMRVVYTAVFRSLMRLGTEELGHDDRTADVAAEGEGDEDQR